MSNNKNNPALASTAKQSQDDSASLGSTVSTSTETSSSSSSSTPSPTRPRIASLPLTTVSEACPRSKNQRIQVNGQWGTYSGPSIKSKACVLQGCVVRLESGELYVGSLRRNDTGSFTFHQPGTLYGCNASPKRRIR
mmetsp:Transcript_11324/g.18221  ORF Transcript_11324/g.18221 Transcript_11324/m.18221 type:complete len:137 (-) Transcript_11324:1801-2211(-)